MTRRMFSRLWACIFLLLHLVALACGAEAAGQGSGSSTTRGVLPVDSPSHTSSHIVPSTTGSSLASQQILWPPRQLLDPRLIRTDTASDVGEALKILEKRRSSRHGLARRSRPLGLLDQTFHYSKQLFRILFLNGPPQEQQQQLARTKSGIVKLSKPLAKAVRLLERAAAKNDVDAIFLLAEMNFYGNFSHPRNLHEAFRRYSQLAEMNGNSTAQNMIGFMYATGVGGVVKRNQAQALVYHTFAAAQGNTRSELTLGFRKHGGIGTTRDCDEATTYYKKVADKTMDYVHAGPPGGNVLHRDAYRIADDDGGIYGEGASVSSSGLNANKAPPTSDSHADLEDVVEYLDLMSKKGDFKATYSLGRLYYDRSREMAQDYTRAKQYFMEIAKRYWTREGKVVSTGTPQLAKFAAKAAGYIGRMYLRGEDVTANYDRALMWFRRGLANGDSLCQYELGLMYVDGLGVLANATRAAEYFKASAEQGFPAAQVQLASLFLDQGDVEPATQLLTMAARDQHMAAFYYLAEIHNQDIPEFRDRSCAQAKAYYKIVAERAELLHSPFEEANAAYEDGDIATAALLYMIAAEQGYEKAQLNVAYLLDEQKSMFSITRLLSRFSSRPSVSSSTSVLHDPELALIYYTRAAAQNNYDAMVKMGDYYLLGIGTAHPDAEKAATCYHSAAEFQQSAQALWNLGWMHEHGVGVERDFHMAKRYYDLALEASLEAYLPVKLALARLRIRSWWNGVTGGNVKGIEDDPDPKKPRTFSEWIAHFLESFEEQQQQQQQQQAEDDDDDFFSSTTTADTLSSETSASREHEVSTEEEDDGVVESLLILAGAATLTFLLWWRQQRVVQAHRQQVELAARALEERRRQQQQQQRNGNGNENAGQ